MIRKIIITLILLVTLAVALHFLLSVYPLNSVFSDNGRWTRLSKSWGSFWGYEIEVLKDNRYNVICYLFNDDRRGGLSCFTEEEIKESMRQ